MVSWQAVEAVRERSASKHGARLVLFCLASHARPDGSQAFLSLSTLQREANLSRSRVVEGIRRLRELGEIEQTHTRPGGTPVFRVTLVAGSETEPGSETELAPHGQGGSVSDPTGSVLRRGGSRSEPETSEPLVEARPPLTPPQGGKFIDRRGALCEELADARALLSRPNVVGRQRIARAAAEIEAARLRVKKTAQLSDSDRRRQ